MTKVARAEPSTTVTFEEKGGQTLLVIHDLYPSKKAADEGSGSLDGIPETLEQLGELLVSLERPWHGHKVVDRTTDPAAVAILAAGANAALPACHAWAPDAHERRSRRETGL